MNLNCKVKMILSLLVLSIVSIIAAYGKSPVNNPDLAKKAGIDINSVKPDSYDVKTADGFIMITFRSSVDVEPYLKISNSKNVEVSNYIKTVTPDKKLTLDKNFVYMIHNNSYVYKILVRLPEPDRYTCEIFTVIDWKGLNRKNEKPDKNTKYFTAYIKYSIDAAKGMNLNDYFSRLLKSGIDKDNDNIINLIMISDINMNDKASIYTENNLPLDTTDQFGYTLLAKAVMQGDIETAAKLIKGGADVNHDNNIGETVLMKVLDISKENLQKRLDMLKLLIDGGADVNLGNKYNGKTILHRMAESGADLELVKYLVSRNADVNKGDIDGLTAMHAAEKGPIYEYLKGLGGKKYAFQFPLANDSPLCKVILSKDIKSLNSFAREEFEKLQARTADGIPATVLHLAVEAGDMEVLKALCGMKMNWNASDRYKRTPLFIAVLNNRKDIAALLIKNASDPTIKNAGETSPYLISLFRGTEMLDILLKSEKKPDHIYAIYEAIRTGNLDIVKKIYPYIEKLIQDKDKDKLIDRAGDWGYTEIASYFIKEFSTDKDKADKALERSGKNQKRFAEYNKKNSAPVAVPRKNDGIAGKKGFFKYTLEEFSPFTDETTDLNLAKYPVSLYVPESYNPDKPSGLMLFISWDYPSKEYQKTIEKNNMIWVGFNCYNIDYQPFTEKHLHEVFFLSVIYNILKYYNIDRSRIYMAGMSWGGRLTGEIAPKYPNIFKGGISSAGCLFDLGRNGEYNDSIMFARDNTTMVITSTDYDFNRNEAYGASETFYFLNFRNVYYIQEPRKYHEGLSAANFERAINLLDTGRK